MNDEKARQWSQRSALGMWSAVRLGVPARQSATYAGWPQPERRKRPSVFHTPWLRGSGPLHTYTSRARPDYDVQRKSALDPLWQLEFAKTRPRPSDLAREAQRWIQFVKDYLGAREAEIHTDIHPDGSMSLGWIMRRRRLVLQLDTSLTVKWMVANLAVSPWRESAGIARAPTDLSVALADFVA